MNTLRVSGQSRQFGLYPPLIVLAVLLSGCALFRSGITYFEPTTYKNLTDLKPEVVMLFESFAGDPVDTMWVRSVKLKLYQAYEYEKGKEEKSAETIEQINIIRVMFDRHVESRRQNGPWNQDHMENQIENSEEAFDEAIQTERLKNKSE